MSFRSNGVGVLHKQNSRPLTSILPVFAYRIRTGHRCISCQASKNRSFAGRHRYSSKPVQYEAVKRFDTSEFEIGSELVPLDTPVVIQHQQRGFFPLLRGLLTIESELEVVITRNLDIAENWVKNLQRNETLSSIGYCLHERPMNLKQGSRLAYIPQENGLDTPVSFSKTSPYDGTGLKTQTSYGLTEAEERHLSLRLDDFEEITNETQNEEFASDVNLGDLLTQEHEDDYIDKDDDENQPVVYKVGNVVITDYNPPKISRVSVPRPFPPEVFTRDPVLALNWIRDRDGIQRMKLPFHARPVDKNIVSILTLCHKKHILVLQLRRMSAIGPELTNLLYSENIAKFGFNQQETGFVLEAIGVKIRNGFDLEDLFIKAMRRKSFDDIPKAIRKLDRPQLVRVLTGVDISDIGLYVESWNNPFLSEKYTKWSSFLNWVGVFRELVCAAKEAYSVYSMSQTLNRATYKNFFNLDIFVLNLLPPSFLEHADQLPPTTYHQLSIHRRPFYEDLGKLLEGVDFEVKITITREVSVAEQWARRQLTEKGVDHVGFHHEWIQGRWNQATALFSISTQEEVLICQHLYLTSIPYHLKKLMEWKDIRKTGRALPYLGVFKKDQGRIGLRGYLQIGVLLVKLGGKKRKTNLPKVFRDLKFGDLTKMLIGVDHETGHLSKHVRWDKPDLTTQEVQYQAMEAWLSWALIHIFLKSTRAHGEKFKAYLLGPEFVPRVHRLPSKVRKRFMKELSQEKKKELTLMEGEMLNDEDTNDASSQLELLSSQSNREITHQDLNSLFDTLFDEQLSNKEQTN